MPFSIFLGRPDRYGAIEEEKGGPKNSKGLDRGPDHIRNPG